MVPHLCHVLPAFGTGGPEVRTALMIDATSGEFRHTVISLNGELGGRSRVRHRESVRFLGAPRAGGRLAVVRGLARLLRSLGPDLILTYGWGGTDGVMAARLSGFHRVVHAEDGFLPDEAVRQRPHRLLARRLLLRVPARVVCPSQTLVRIATGAWWLPDRKVAYIPNGIDADRFCPGPTETSAALRIRLGCSEGEIIIGTVGRLGAEKNHARLVRAFHAVASRHRVHLLIVGDGPQREALGRLARSLGLADRVDFAGQIDDPADHYRAMDLFALPSDTEQMPIAVLEAMAVGLPIVGTDVGDVRGMVSPENRRFVVEPSREDAFVAALDELAEDTQTRATLGRINRETCRRRYTLGEMIRSYIDLYHDVLGAKP